MNAPVEKVTARVVVERLRRHYLKPGPMPGGMFLAEVGLNGPAQQRRVDAVHVGFTSASGRILTGHEVKISRSDWLAELAKPGKADTWADQCHAWYVVAADREIVHLDELPEDWGLMVPSTKTTTRCDVLKKARVHSDRHPSWLIVRSIMSANDTRYWNEIEQAKREANQRAYEEVSRRDDARRTALLTGDEQAAKEFLVAVKKIVHPDDAWRRIDPAVVARAVADAEGTRAAANSACREVELLLGAAQRLFDDGPRGPLGELAKITRSLRVDGIPAVAQ